MLRLVPPGIERKRYQLGRWALAGSVFVTLRTIGVPAHLLPRKEAFLSFALEDPKQAANLGCCHRSTGCPPGHAGVPPSLRGALGMHRNEVTTAQLGLLPRRCSRHYGGERLRCQA